MNEPRSTESGEKACRPARRNGVTLQFVRQAREDVFREESLLNITVFGISVSILGLNAGLRREFPLYKGISDFIPLVEFSRNPSVVKWNPPTLKDVFW